MAKAVSIPTPIVREYFACILVALFISLPLQAQIGAPNFSGFESANSPSISKSTSHSEPGIYRLPPRTAGIATMDTLPVSNAAWTTPGTPSQPIASTNPSLESRSGKPLWDSSNNANATTLKKPKSVWSSTISMFMSLLLVLTLFMGVAWLFRGTTQQQARYLSKDVVQVLGRTPLAPRHQMILIRFGRKLVLVSQQLGQSQTLSEIEDPHEVDHLLGLCEQNSSNSISNSFRDVLSQLTSGKNHDPLPSSPRNPSIARGI